MIVRKANIICLTDDFYHARLVNFIVVAVLVGSLSAEYAAAFHRCDRPKGGSWPKLSRAEVTLCVLKSM